MPLIIGAKSASAATGVDNSCRFDYGDSAYLTRTPASNGSETISTFSVWCKRSGIDTVEEWIYHSVGDSSNKMIIRFNTDDTFDVRNKVGGSFPLDFETNRLFRDPGAWMHFVFKFDTTQATEADRFKMYVNGVQETSFSTETYPAQDTNLSMNQTDDQVWICDQGYFDGYLAEVVFCDGQAYDASDFGEFNEDSPTIWQPKSADDISGLTFGDNGFYLNFEDSADLGADASGNSNDFTATNLAAINQTTDTPTNNFCTFNPLAPSSVGQNLENGNLYCPGPNSPNYWQSVPSTLGARAGKWYWEFKDENSWGDTSNDTRRYGICDLDTIVQTLSSGADVSFSDTTSAYAYMNVSGVRYNGGTISGTDANYPTFEPGDILMCAMDLDNQKLYFGKNGTWLDSSDPTSGATGTGSVADISATATWSPYVETHYGSDNVSVNFGNPIAAPSSGNADGNGYGNFEYAPPSGYLALCTKNLGSDGG